MDECKCEKPTPWVDNKGNESNVCKACSGKIEQHRLPEIGRYHTTVDAVLLGDLGLDTDHPFITWLANSARADLRQKKLIWDHNRRVAATVKPT